MAKSWDLICPYRRGRRRKRIQGGRDLPRILVRHAFCSFVLDAFAKRACIKIPITRLRYRLQLGV